MAILTWLGVPGKSSDWQGLGFEVTDGTIRIGRVVHAVDTQPSWGFDELHADVDALGIPTRVEPLISEPGRHPNGVDRVDHVVYAVPELDPFVDRLTAVLGEPPRRRA